MVTQSVADQVVLPSTLRYKERVTLSREAPYEYGKIYSADHQMSSNVWGRLVADATVRQSISAQNSRPTPDTFGRGIPEDTTASGGFVQNNHHTTKLTRGQTVRYQEPPVDSLHDLTAKSYKQKYPVDFMTAVRPDTETTNQTLRMMGTYKSDYAVASRFNMNIPNGCPGGKGAFHPDVTLGRYSQKL